MGVDPWARSWVSPHKKKHKIFNKNKRIETFKDLVQVKVHRRLLFPELGGHQGIGLYDDF